MKTGVIKSKGIVRTYQCNTSVARKFMISEIQFANKVVYYLVIAQQTNKFTFLNVQRVLKYILLVTESFWRRNSLFVTFLALLVTLKHCIRNSKLSLTHLEVTTM